MLAKGSQEPPTCLWNFRLLSRSGRLLLEKLTHSFQNRGFQTQAGWLPLPVLKRLAFSAFCELRFLPGGKAVLGDLFSGPISLELVLSPESHTHRGRQNHMDKSLLHRRTLVNLSL